MEYIIEINLLSSKFINDYPLQLFPEIMYKQGRPYSCLLIDTHCDYLICVPYRSCINHKNAYLFKNTQRSQISKSGLDYSKIVLVKDLDYIDSNSTAIIDQDEYNQTMTDIDQIISEVTKYVDEYISHVSGIHLLHPREFARKYQFSTLPYFHDIIGI